MVRHLLRFFALLAAGAAVILPAAAEEKSLAVTASYRARIAVPPGAELLVELLDVSLADAPSALIAAKRVAIDRVPTTVELTYDDAVIDEQMTYVISAQLLTDRRTMFRTTQEYPVLTHGAPSEDISVMMEMMGSSGPREAAAHPLVGDEWQAVELGGEAIEVGRKPTLAFRPDGQFALFAGCNRFAGKAELGEATIAFPENFAGTMMACMGPEAELERRVIDTIGAVRGFRRDGQQAFLLDGEGDPLLRLVVLTNG